MKKNLTLILLLAILVSGCSQETLLENESVNGRTFTASFEQNESRTYIEEGNLLRWTEGDQISLFEGYTLNNKYQFDGETGDNGGTFSKVNSPFGTGNELSSHYAVYPYASNVKITEKGVLTVTLPAEQAYADNSFGLGANTMVAITENTDDTFLKFQNVGGYLKLQLYGDNATIKSIKLTGNNNEKLAGKANITAVYGQVPTIVMSTDASENITLDCGEGVKISSTEETATAFWFVVPPITFENGFTVTITEVNGNEIIKSTSNEISIDRNVIKPMTAFEVEVQTDNIPYVTFTANAEQTFSMSKAVETLEYSLNSGEWNTLGTTTITFGGDNGNLRLRGKSSIGTAISAVDYATIKFGMDVIVACTGDIRTLVDYDNYENTNTSNARFCRLFSDCTSLTQAPELPATTLASSCYSNMFRSCTNLTKAPKLPATTLDSFCYNFMFSGCTSLTKAPELPATILDSYCYYYMFSGCTNLAQAPELPATTLDSYCYYFMFSGCTSLTKAPELPATTLAETCYFSMFSGCTSLTEAPELPATTLAYACYRGMFEDCTSLTQAPELPATTLAKTCYFSMFSGCTSLTKAPKLPATILAYACYRDMFGNCTSLTQAPELPATTLAERCYFSMFSGCSNLNSINMLATNIDAADCLNNWVDGVASTGIFTKAKEMTSLTKGINGIPYGWIVKNYNEE